MPPLLAPIASSHSCVSFYKAMYFGLCATTQQLVYETFMAQHFRLSGTLSVSLYRLSQTQQNCKGEKLLLGDMVCGRRSTRQEISLQGMSKYPSLCFQPGELVDLVSSSITITCQQKVQEWLQTSVLYKQ